MMKNLTGQQFSCIIPTVRYFGLFACVFAFI